MKYYKFMAETPYAGTDNEFYMSFEDNEVTEEHLDVIAAEYGNSNAETFEYLIFGWDNDPVGEGDMTEEEYDEEVQNYYADCFCTYEEISEEEYLEYIG
jgi:hypothetical protein